MIYKAFSHFYKTAEMLKTIKTIKTIIDAHSPVLIRAVCYNIPRPKEPQEPIKEKRGKGGFLFNGISLASIVFWAHSGAGTYPTPSRGRGGVQISTAYMLDNGQGTLRKKSHKSKGEYTPQ